MIGRFAVILVAAGKSTRFAANALKKPFVDLCGKAVWEHSAALFAGHPSVAQILVVLSAEDRRFFEKQYADRIAAWSLDLVDGGRERFESVENGLKQVRNDINFVAIHDAARPCVTKNQIDAVFSAAQQHGAAILASPVVGTLKRVAECGAPCEKPVDADQVTDTVHGLRNIVGTVPRHDLWEAQTPQAFCREWIVEACDKRDTFHVTDDAQLLEKIGRSVKIVPSERTNLKITTPFDLVVARQILIDSEHFHDED